MRWLTESAVPFVQHRDVHPSPEECFLHAGTVPEDNANHPLSFDDLRPFFLLHVILLVASAVLFVLEILVSKIHPWKSASVKPIKRTVEERCACDYLPSCNNPQNITKKKQVR